jgi:hypothetical protein
MKTKRDITYWRSVCLGIAIGFLITNGAWFWLCLHILEKNQ